MIKQWKNNNLGVTYFHVPNSKNDEILTSDGVLIPFVEFKNMSAEQYNAYKNSNGGYDYKSSLDSQSLVKSTSRGENDYTNTSRKKTTTDDDRIKRMENTIKKSMASYTYDDGRNSIKTEALASSKEPNDDIMSEDDEKMNIFDWIYPKIMILLTLTCSTLSIYFTATYLQRLQNIILAYSISTSMLLFGMIGFQMGRRKRKEKHYGQCAVYFTTSIVVILFSMLSSIDVNYAKYKLNHKTDETEYNVNDGIRMNYELLSNELADNKSTIAKLQDDISFQQTQWVISWDNELKKNVLLEGRISATAQEKISEDNELIAKLTERNKEITSLLLDYAESGVSMSEKNTDLEKSNSLTDLLGRIFGVSGDLVQLLFLLVPSFFIDIINILSVSIYCDKFEMNENPKGD